MKRRFRAESGSSPGNAAVGAVSRSLSQIDVDPDATSGPQGVRTDCSGRQRAPKRRTSITIVVALIAATFVAINHRQVTALRDRFIPKRWGVVEPGKIYRSGQLSRHLVKETLEKHHIRRVVDLTFDNPDDENHSAELAAIAELGIERKLCPLDSDGTGDVHIYAQAVAAVSEAERQGKPVLVHCYAGAQRTGGVVALYRLLVERKPPAEVLHEMQQYQYDPVRSPKLLNYLNEHIGDVAADLVRAGVISTVPEPLPKLSAD